MKGQSIAGLVLNLFMIGFLAAFAEELFFRGVFQKIILKGTGNIHIAVWVTGIVFSAVHMEFFGFLPRMLMGVYLGYLFVWSKSIWVPIFAHFVNNATVVILTFLEERNIMTSKVEDLGTQSSEMSYVLVSVLLVAILMFVIYKTEHRKAEIPAG